MKNVMMALTTVFTGVMAMGVMAENTNTVKVTKFHQPYPYMGKAAVEYTVGGTLPANAVAEFTISTDDASATFTQKGIVTGANTNVIDFASSFGGAMRLTNASFIVTIKFGGVQLWENGPCWAECNVGASTPEEYGYYFWWGDTVGYTNTGSGWISVKDGTSTSFSGSGTAASTYGKDNSALLSAGYIDSTGNLVAEHDAATAHLGAPWRMPTRDEIDALISNCTTAWITTNGVSGRLVFGKGAYADRSIFLPATGHGDNSSLYYTGSYGFYWSSTSVPSGSASILYFYYGTSKFLRYNNYCFRGQSVRPVRGFVSPCNDVGIVTYAVPVSATPVISPASGTAFEGSLTITISCATDGAAVYYTTDGSEPTESSPLYTEPFAINDTTTVKAKAFKEDWFDSETATATFTRYTVATPVIEPSSMTFENVSQTVSISCATEGATILYTTDGSDPAANGLEYRKPFSVYSSCTVRAVAVKDDWKNSQVATSTLSRSESLSEAVNLYGYTMETDGNANWTVDADVSHDGVSSVRSGAIGNNGTTWLQTSIKKAGTVSFWWKAACEDADEEEGEDGYYDYGAFLVDDVVVARIAGHDGEWYYVSHEITSGGKHTLKWEYRKDGATSYAPDCVWVDQVQWIPADGSGYTLTTPEPVPYSWFDAYRLGVGTDYETAGNAASGKMQGGRVLQVWQDYVAGTDPTNLTSRFTAKIEMVDGAPVVTWEPDLNTNGAIRTYKVYGKETLENGGEWQYPTNSLHRFFKVTVEMP